MNRPSHSSRLGVARWKLLLGIAALTGVTAAARQQAPAAPPATQQPSAVELRITNEGGSIPHYAVPDFVPLNPEAAEIAKMLGQVMWDDLNYEREFDMIPRDTAATVPAARTPEQIPFNSWRELNADGVVFGSVQKTGKDVKVQIRLYNARTRQQVFGAEYAGTDTNPRGFAHTAADEIYLQQRNLHGVARTKLAFVSDRQRQRVRGTGQLNRESKEIWIADYDGANQRQITVGSSWLNLSPSWSPDARAIVYTSYRKVATGGAPDVYISRIYQGVLENPTKGRAEQNIQPVFSPDGTRIAFWSNRDGNSEIYVMNVDGSGLRRLTYNPAADSVPTWSPTGAQIAFTSDRTGTPQIYVMDARDGSSPRKITSESYADRATWAPAPYNEIAFAARTGPGFDIKVFDLSSGETRQLTFGEGSNESPAYSPNGRHLAFMSTRKGNAQIFTMTRDGRDVRQVTTSGNNTQPAWSR